MPGSYVVHHFSSIFETIMLEPKVLLVCYHDPACNIQVVRPWNVRHTFHGSNFQWQTFVSPHKIQDDTPNAYEIFIHVKCSTWMNAVGFLCLSPPPVLSFIVPPPPWKILRHFGKLTVVLWGVRMKRKRAGGGREWKRGRDKDMHCKSTEIRLWYKHNLHGSYLTTFYVRWEN